MGDFNGIASLLTAIVEAAKDEDCVGLCLVRGGGDPNSFSTWNDSHLIEALIRTEKPFYTALGHTHDLTLANKYADECFVTPSALGKVCADAWRMRGEQQQKDELLNNLRSENRRLRTVKEGASRTDIDQKILRLQTSLEEFQKLPTILHTQTGQAITAAIKVSMQDHFKQTLSDAVQGPIANLTQVTEQARGVLDKTIGDRRFRAWSWLASVFLLGIVAGAYGLYSLERSAIFGMKHEATVTQQPITPATKPPERKEHPGH